MKIDSKLVYGMVGVIPKPKKQKLEKEVLQLIKLGEVNEDELHRLLAQAYRFFETNPAAKAGKDTWLCGL